MALNKKDFNQIFQYEIRQLASKYNIKSEEVVDIYFKQFKFASKYIRDSFDKEGISFKLPHLGMFKYNKFKIDKIKENEQRKILDKTSAETRNRDQSN